MALYTSALWHWRLEETYQVFGETVGYCEAQQEVHIHVFGTRGLGKVVY